MQNQEINTPENKAVLGVDPIQNRVETSSDTTLLASEQTTNKDGITPQSSKKKSDTSEEASDRQKDAIIQSLREENQTKDLIIENLTNELATTSASKKINDDLIIELDGEKYMPEDGTTKAIHHNQVIVKLQDFTPEMVKEYYNKGFLIKI